MPKIIHSHWGMQESGCLEYVRGKKHAKKRVKTKLDPLTNFTSRKEHDKLVHIRPGQKLDGPSLYIGIIIYCWMMLALKKNSYNNLPGKEMKLLQLS